MPCQHMVLNFPGHWVRRAVPTSGFSNFVALNRFGVAGAPLSHLVSHVKIVRSSCRHVWRLRYLRFGIRSAQLTDCTQFFFFQRSYGWSRLTQPGTRPFQGAFRRLKSGDGLSSSSHVRKTNTPFFACSGILPCTCLSHRCDTGTRVWQYEGSTSVEDHDVAFVNHS